MLHFTWKEQEKEQKVHKERETDIILAYSRAMSSIFLWIILCAGFCFAICVLWRHDVTP